MKTQLCNFCIKSGILCPKCQENVQSGTISETYLKIAKLLLKLEERYPPLQKMFLHNVYDVDNVLALVVKSGDLSRFLLYGGRILRDISESARKRVRILEKSGDTRRFLEDLFMPANIVAINTIWLPDGSTETRVVISGRSRKLSMSRKVLKELAKKIRGITLRITFEDQKERYYH